MSLVRICLYTISAALFTVYAAACWADGVPPQCESALLCLAAGSVEGAPGAAVEIDVTSVVDQADSTLVYSDLILPGVVHPDAHADGTPACRAGDGIHAAYTDFTFLPPGCAPAVDCAAVHALIASDVAFGSPRILYSCSAQIAPDAEPGRYPVNMSRIDALADNYPVCATNNGICDPNDPAYPLIGIDGEVSVLGPPGSTPLPTSTPQPTRTPTPTETPCAPFCPGVVVSSTTAVPGEAVTVSITFRAGATPVSGLQTDVIFDPATPITRCMINPAIEKGLSGVRVAEGHVRATVIGLDPDNLLQDGALLYTCTLLVAADAEPGAYPLQVKNVLGSTSLGQQVHMVGEDGQVVVVIPVPGATPIPTHTPSPTPTARPTVPRMATPLIQVTSPRGAPGETVSVAVQVFDGGPFIPAMQNDLTFEPAAVTVANADGKPNCAADPSVGANEAAFVFFPPGCQPGIDCDTVRAQLAALGTLDLHDEGSVLYRCSLQIKSETPPGFYPLHLSFVSLATADGVPLAISMADGALEVTTPAGATPRPTWTASPTPTAVPTLASLLSLTISDVVAMPGTLASVAVTIQTDGAEIVGVDHTIEFDAGAPIVFCTGSELTSLYDFTTAFVFEPTGCRPGIDCSQVHTTVSASDPVDGGIPDGVLYTCAVRIPVLARAGSYGLTTILAGAVDLSGNVLSLPVTDGSITVLGPSPSPSPTSLPNAQGEPAVQGTGGSAAMGSGGGSCSLRPPGDGDDGALLPLAVALTWLSRRRRRD